MYNVKRLADVFICQNMKVFEELFRKDDQSEIILT